MEMLCRHTPARETHTKVKGEGAHPRASFAAFGEIAVPESPPMGDITPSFCELAASVTSENLAHNPIPEVASDWATFN